MSNLLGVTLQKMQLLDGGFESLELIGRQEERNDICRRGRRW